MIELHKDFAASADHVICKMHEINALHLCKLLIDMNGCIQSVRCRPSGYKGQDEETTCLPSQSSRLQLKCHP